MICFPRSSVDRSHHNMAIAATSNTSPHASIGQSSMDGAANHLQRFPAHMVPVVCRDGPCAENSGEGHDLMNDTNEGAGYCGRYTDSEGEVFFDAVDLDLD